MTLAARIALVVVLVAELMNILDSSIVLTALPTLQKSLGAGPAALQWATAGYSLTIAMGLITGSRPSAWTSPACCCPRWPSS
ncbi:hypothetical protein [Streptomyces sp. Je 1-369]|uniref:hypothetical protein n=1 Tax=Streptomyces sp. Je 1-369 TaxID=2966192 RepID=UPI00228558E7|nr:hypothetical protein [Streptomyces sp. Je 1-369]WAL99318.1 hypothetical protein NOO62_35510 [Streptomyces sp. Je 1-369]